jgi:hypothetical protein
MSGILGQSAPSTETVLYKTPPGKVASTTLLVTNTNATTSDTYDIAVRDYDRILTLSDNDTIDSELNQKSGLILSDRVITVTTSTGDIDVDINEGDTITFLQSGTQTPTGSTAKVAKIFERYNVVEVVLDSRVVDVIQVSTFAAGAIEIGDQLTDGTDVGDVKDILDPGGGLDITLVVQMSAGNFIGTEVLDNVTKGTTTVTTVNTVLSTAAPALFDQNTNDLFTTQVTGDGTIYAFSVEDASLAANGFDIYTDSGLSSADTVNTYRYGTPGDATGSTYYLIVDSSSEDTYYIGDGAYVNLTNSIDTTGTAYLTGTNNALLLYSEIVDPNQSISVNDDFISNGNTFTVQIVNGTSSAITIGKYNTSTNDLKVIEYDYVNNPIGVNTLLYNNETTRFYLPTVTTSVGTESYISKTTSLNAASTAKISGLILDQDQSVVVNCASTTDISFTLIGFEEAL